METWKWARQSLNRRDFKLCETSKTFGFIPHPFIHSFKQLGKCKMTIEVVNHPVLLHKLSLLRDVRTKSKQFRDLVYEVTLLLGMQATQTLDLIQTTRQVCTYSVIFEWPLRSVG